MPSSNVQVCRFCVMDANHPGVEFDATGQCNCCTAALRRMPLEWWPGETGARKMQDLMAQLREEGRGKPYDAMIGLSGGIDSAYLAHILTAKHNLRVLAVHVDGGWNSVAAVSNIESLVRKTGIDLHTVVIEWDEMRDLQLAFLRAGVFNQDFPQDHAFFTTLVRTANKYDIRSFLSGVNFSSENVEVPSGPSVTAYDGKHLRAIHERFGSRPLRTFPVSSLLGYIWSTRVRGRPVVHKPLNFIDYDKEKAKDTLREVYGWRDYGAKHSESRFTKFYQEIYLPRKYFMDKRRLHMSSLIVAGQATREEALEEVALPALEPEQAARDIRFVAKKLGIGVDELNELIDAPPVLHVAYPNDMALQRNLLGLQEKFRRVRARLLSRGGGESPKKAVVA